MIINCDACGTSFKVKSSLIKETGSTVRCSKCQYLFIAYPPSAETVASIELMSDENIETSIDDTFGKEADEKYLSDFFGEEDQAVESEAKPEPAESLRDLEAEIDADMSALSAEITEDLFDETQMRFDGPGQESGEPEVLLSDLEEEDGEMLDLEDLEGETEGVIELDALAEPEADDIIDIGSLVRTAEEEEENVFLDDLESEEGISSETVDAEEEMDFESLETAESDMDETVIIEDFEIGKDGVAQPDFADFEDLETDEGVISLETVDAEEDMDDESIEAAAMEEATETAEYADVETDAKGGVEAQLDEFEAEKEPEGEKPSKQAAEVTGKKEPEEAFPAEDKAADTEDVELDFDLDDTVALEKTTETAEFELDFEADLDEALAEDKVSADSNEEIGEDFDLDFESDEEKAEPVEAASEAEDAELDFDLDETVALETSAVTDEFDLNLEEEEDLGETASDTQDLELDFESDLDEALEALETEADAQDLNLDLDETEALETAGLDEDFDLDFEGESKVSSPTEESEDIGLDLDLDAFDLDLETAEGEDAGEDEFDLGLEPEDIDLKTQLYEVDETAEADAEDEIFDLDLELAAEDKSAEQVDDFVMDLDIEPEAKPDKEADEFELDFEEVIEEPGVVATQEDLDFGEEEAAPSKKTSEELDLSEIEDFLDFGEDEEETQLAEASESMGRVAEMEADTLDMDMDLDFETVTAPEEEAEVSEISIDLETMIDEEIGMEKEVSLETTEERKQRITDQYRKEAEVVPQPRKEAEKIAAVDAMEADVTAVAAPVPVREKRELLKPILVIILVLLLSGVLIYTGIKFFSAPKEVPEVVDPTGKLQIEMIRNPEYAFVANDIAGELFVVTGHVTNQYDQPRSHIQVKATVYDAAGKVVVTSGAYCGNMLSDSDLSALDLETINRRLANPEGDANANVGVKPGARVPFMVVFSNLPENIDEMTVEVVASIP
jgi:predicted Zn finger-like uncharacterized protein